MRWEKLAEEIHNYKKEYVDLNMLLSDGRHVLEVSHPSTIHCFEEDNVWSTIYFSSLSIVEGKMCFMDMTMIVSRFKLLISDIIINYYVLKPTRPIQGHIILSSEVGTFQKLVHENGSMHGTTYRAHKHV